MKVKKNPFIQRQDLIPSMKGEFRGFKLKPYFRKAGRPDYVKRILVVDDDKDVLNMYNRLLTHHGFDVVCVDPLGSITKQVESMYLHVKQPVEAGGMVELGITEWDLLIMDGDLGKNETNLTGMALILRLRENGYKNWIFANSGTPDLQKAMLAVGADHAVEGKSPTALVEMFIRGEATK